MQLTDIVNKEIIPIYFFQIVYQEYPIETNS